VSAGDLGDDLTDDLVLDEEDIGHLPIEPVGPNVGAGLGIDELRGDAEAVRRRGERCPPARNARRARARVWGRLRPCPCIAILCSARARAGRSTPSTARSSGPRSNRRSEGEVGELHVGLKGTMNALFLKDLAQKTRRGLEGRVRQGKSGGGL